MRNSFFCLLLVPVFLFSASLVHGQLVQMGCDSTYIELFSKSDFDDNRIPCDTFVVLGRGYYERISIGYNLRGDIVAGQGKVIDNLTVQVQLAKERADTLQRIIALEEATLRDYRNLADGYERDLQNSLSLNKTVVDSTRMMLTQLRTQHLKEVKRSKREGILLGGAFGAFIGFVVAVLLLR